MILLLMITNESGSNEIWELLKFIDRVKCKKSRDIVVPVAGGINF